MRSKVSVYGSRMLGIVVLLCGTVGLCSWVSRGGLGSGQVELLVLSFGALWLGREVLDRYGQLSRV